jgi:hypothetical protein
MRLGLCFEAMMARLGEKLAIVTTGRPTRYEPIEKIGQCFSGNNCVSKSEPGMAKRRLRARFSTGLAN